MHPAQETKLPESLLSQLLAPCADAERFATEEAQKRLTASIMALLQSKPDFSITYSPKLHPAGKNHFLSYSPHWWPQRATDNDVPDSTLPWGKSRAVGYD